MKSENEAGKPVTAQYRKI